MDGEGCTWCGLSYERELGFGKNPFSTRHVATTYQQRDTPDQCLTHDGYSRSHYHFKANGNSGHHWVLLVHVGNSDGTLLPDHWPPRR